LVVVSLPGGRDGEHVAGAEFPRGRVAGCVRSPAKEVKG